MQVSHGYSAKSRVLEGWEVSVDEIFRGIGIRGMIRIVHPDHPEFEYLTYFPVRWPWWSGGGRSS
jgi:hypothetical protein